MFKDEFSDKIRFTRKNGESIELDQSRVKLRENEKGLMAISYVAPVFEANDLERFFADALTSEKLMIDICGTGDSPVFYRGIVEGKGMEMPENIDHKIILLQTPVNLDPRENIQITGFSKFKMGYTTS